jgi:hypothetical protein
MSEFEAEVCMHFHGENDLAVRVSDDSDIKKSVWLAKSQITIERLAGDNIWLTIPEWLGKQKGLF